MNPKWDYDKNYRGKSHILFSYNEWRRKYFIIVCVKFIDFKYKFGGSSFLIILNYFL